MTVKDVYQKIVDAAESGQKPSKVILSDDLYVELVEMLRNLKTAGEIDFTSAYPNLDTPSTILGGLLLKGNDFEVVFNPASAIEFEII